MGTRINPGCGLRTALRLFPILLVPGLSAAADPATVEVEPAGGQARFTRGLCCERSQRANVDRW